MKNNVTPTSTDQTCCYADCPLPGTYYIGTNGNPGTQWICVRHLERWNQTRARFLAEGGGCEMEELGDFLERD